MVRRLTDKASSTSRKGIETTLW